MLLGLAKSRMKSHDLWLAELRHVLCGGIEVVFIPVFHEDFQVSSHSSFLLKIFARRGGAVWPTQRDMGSCQGQG